MFKTRLLSGIVLVVIALLTICRRRRSFCYHLDHFLDRDAGAVPGDGRAQGEDGSSGTGRLRGGYPGYYAAMYAGEFYQLMAVLAAVILVMCVYVFTYPRYKAEEVMAAAFGVLYVGVMLSCVYLTRELPGGAWHVWLILLCSWGCDTCAYCAGMLFGKHKMAPVLSPKKSVEGAVGGVAGAALLGALYALAANHFGNPSRPLP